MGAMNANVSKTPCEMPHHVLVLNDQKKLTEVFGLYRKDSNTLGFMPEGAFEQAIANGRLLVAQGDSEKILGYLFFRLARGRAAIVHLCISQDERNKGIARELVSRLKKITAHLECITLRCRRDYAVNDLWPKYGFHPKGAIQGRGTDGAELTIWHFDHGHHDLFSALSSDKVKVALDTNVFLDLTRPDREHHEKAQGLTEGWLDDVFELVVTPEIFNDIARCPDDSLRTSSRSLLQNYKVLRIQADTVIDLAKELTRKYTDFAKNERGSSDIKHLAYCVLAGVRYFVTRDELVLELSAEFLQSYDVLVLSPVELISRHDAIERESEYQPKRLRGTRLFSLKLTAEQLDGLVEVFRYKANEKTHHFSSIVNDLLATPRVKHVQLVQDEDNPLVLIGHGVCEGLVTVELLRMSSHPLAPTVIRHSLMELIHSSVSDSHSAISIGDPYLGTEVTAALKELGFVIQDKKWMKPLLSGFMTDEQIHLSLQRYGVRYEQLSPDELGTFFWPAKFDSSDVPCYLVPIQAQWAEHFFDTDLASQRLPQHSDIRTELHLGVEAVYYSASRNKFVAPGHILWYVSLGSEDMGSMTVKATSRLRGVVCARPKELFKQFQRLGVYQWKQVYEAARKDITRELTALRFSHTERYIRPITKKQLADFGIKGNLQGPMSIPHHIFKKIHILGTNL